MTIRTASVIRTEISALLAVEHLVQTNSGTFGPHEACRKVGTGDPAFATRNVYAGYYDHNTRLRVEKLFKCSHPVFGAATNGPINPNEAILSGVMAARS